MKLLPKVNLGVQSLALLFFMVVNARDLEISKKSEFMKTDYVNFNYNDLKVGAKMPVYFGCALKGEIPQFLPKEIADKIPFSSQKLPFLLNYFGFHAESPQEKAMNYSLKTCETNVKGGAKKCVTSLKSMIDFVRKSFKTSITTTKNRLVDDLKVLSTSPLPKSSKRFQTYTIVDQPKRVSSPNIMACHAMTYPYAMYFCHYPEPENRVYEFSMVGDEDGTRMDAVTTCHMNTAHFNPDLTVFRMFGTKPGDPVCHFLLSDTLLWVPALALSKVSNATDGQKYTGEYWGAKAIEARLTDGQKYSGYYSRIVKDLKPTNLQWSNNNQDDGATSSKYFVKDFEPNLEEVILWSNHNN